MPAGEGTFIYALYVLDKAVFVGQCKDIHRQIDEHSKNGVLQFDRYTYNFLEGIKLGTEMANTMEAIAIVRLKPLLNESLPPTENYCIELQNFCERYNNLESTSYPIPFRLMRDIVKSQQLKPLYKTGGKTYYRVTDLSAILSGPNAIVQGIPVVTITEGGQAA